MAEIERDIVKTFFISNTRVRISDTCCRNRTSEEVSTILARIAERAQAEISASQPQEEPPCPPNHLERETL